MAWISGAAAVVGDIFSSNSQSATNAMSTANMLQNEKWQETMSDTAMQRRVDDLKAAGLNPILATGTNGAQVGGVGQPNLGNPGASFGNLGSQVSNAIQTASTQRLQESQAKKNEADAANTEYQTENTLPAQVDQIKSQTGVNTETAYKVTAQTGLIAKQIGSAQWDIDTAANRAQISALDVDVLKATKEALISAASSDAMAKRLGLAQLINMNAVQQGQFGRTLAYINSLLPAIGTGVGVATGLGRVGTMMRGAQSYTQRTQNPNGTETTTQRDYE